MKTNLDTKYYYIINDDLKISKGKIAAQVSHVAMQLGVKYEEIGRAIVLKSPEKILVSIKNCLNAFYIEDAGFTEVPAGSLTCVGFKNSRHSEENELLKNLKLV